MNEATDAQPNGRENDAATEPLHRPTRTIVARFARHALLIGIIVSLIFHVLGLMTAAWIVFQRGQAGGAGPGREIELAVITEAELDQIQQASLQVENPTVPDAAIPDTSLLDQLSGPINDQKPSFLEDMGDLDASISSGSGDLTGSSLTAGGTGGGAASFFGVEARGSRFAYVVDVSGSMRNDGRIEALRVELNESIKALMGHASFLVTLYSTDAWYLGARDEWTDASSSGKRWAANFIAKISAGGSTNPVPAFDLVFAIRPKPDAIYFMTDGEFNPEVAGDIANRNARTKIPIHCITFHYKGAEDVMKRIASESGGTYTHIPGPGG